MVKDLLEIYSRNIISIVYLTILVVIPVNLFNHLLILYVMNDGMYQYPSLLVGCVLICNFIVLFPPFMLMAKRYSDDREIYLKECLNIFFYNFAFLSMTTILVYIIGLVGAVLLFIPTIIGAALLFITPLYVEEHTIGASLKQAWSTFKKEHISIFTDMIFILSVQLLVWWAATLMVDSFENNVLVYLVLRILINALVFPVCYFYLYLRYGSYESIAGKEFA